jgi:hypothetical protein
MLTDETKALIRQAVVEYVRSGEPFRLTYYKLSQFHNYVSRHDIEDVIRETIEELARRGANADKEVEEAIKKDWETRSGYTIKRMPPRYDTPGRKE